MFKLLINLRKALYEDELAKKRIQLRLALERQSADENLKKQEESIRRQEDLRRATIMYEQEMRVNKINK